MLAVVLADFRVGFRPRAILNTGLGEIGAVGRAVAAGIFADPPVELFPAVFADGGLMRQMTQLGAEALEAAFVRAGLARLLRPERLLAPDADEVEHLDRSRSLDFRGFLFHGFFVFAPVSPGGHALSLAAFQDGSFACVSGVEVFELFLRLLVGGEFGGGDLERLGELGNRREQIAVLFVVV